MNVPADDQNYVDAGKGLEPEEDTPRVSEDFYPVDDGPPAFNFSNWSDHGLVMERNAMMEDIAEQRDHAGEMHPGTAAHAIEWEAVYHMQVELKQVIAELAQRGIS